MKSRNFPRPCQHEHNEPCASAARLIFSLHGTSTGKLIGGEAQPAITQRKGRRRISTVLAHIWALSRRPSGALLSPPVSPSTSIVGGTVRMMISGSTPDRQAQLPSGQFAACWPIGLGSYNGGPAVFLASKRRILDPREEVLPIPIPDEAVPLLSEASERTKTYDRGGKDGTCWEDVDVWDHVMAG